MVRTRRQIADGAESSESEAEDGPAVPFVRPTQASALLERLPTEVLALVLQDDLAGYSKAKALYERKTKLMLVCQAFADAGRAFGFDEAFITSIRSLDALYAAVTAVGPDDAKPTSVRMRIRKLSVGITSSSSTYRRHASMIAAVVERCVGLVALKVEHDTHDAPAAPSRGRRRSRGGTVARDQAEVPFKHLFEVLPTHSELETVDAPGEHALSGDILACVDGMAKLRSLDTLRVRVSKSDSGGGSSDAPWTIEIAEAESRWSSYSIGAHSATEFARAFGAKLGALHVAAASTIPLTNLADIAAHCVNLSVLDVSVDLHNVDVDRALDFLIALPLRELWLTIPGGQTKVPEIVYALSKTSAQVIQLEPATHFSLALTSLAALQTSIERLAAPPSAAARRSLILKSVGNSVWRAPAFTDAEKDACIASALDAGFDLFFE